MKQSYIAGSRILVGLQNGIPYDIVPLHDEIRTTMEEDYTEEPVHIPGEESAEISGRIYTPTEALENEMQLDADMDIFDGAVKRSIADPAFLRAWAALYSEWRAYFVAHGTKFKILVSPPGAVYTATEKFRTRLNDMIAKYKAVPGIAPLLIDSSTATKTAEQKAADEKAAALWPPSVSTLLAIGGIGAILLGGVYLYKVYQYSKGQVRRVRGAAPYVLPGLTRGMVSPEAARHLLGK